LPADQIAAGRRRPGALSHSPTAIAPESPGGASPHHAGARIMPGSGAALPASAFYLKNVILRLSDFKSNDYANLIGGKAYEPIEENPMIDFLVASRYHHPRYQVAFALECRAVRKVREEMSLTNLKVTLPFCRTVEEGRRMQTEMAKHGLKRGVKASGST
jgi:phosphoenolpyruvate synthase/pyruvate phosphate dikinase